MKNFIEKHPLWFALSFTIVVEQLLGLVVFVVGARIVGLPELPVRVVVVLVVTVVALYFIWWLGWWEDAGLGSTIHNAYALAVPCILMFFPLVFSGTVEIESQRVTLFLLAVLFTGISEEAIFRGLFVRAFLPRGKWQALLIPSVLFAASHFSQSLGGLMTLQDNLTQIAGSLIFGILYGAVALRINNIWPLMLTHAVFDLFYTTSGLLDGVYQLSDIPLSLNLVLWVPSIVAVAYLMNKPLAATIDGQPVGMINEPHIPAVEG